MNPKFEILSTQRLSLHYRLVQELYGWFDVEAEAVALIQSSLPYPTQPHRLGMNFLRSHDGTNKPPTKLKGQAMVMSSQPSIHPSDIHAHYASTRYAVSE